jgi:hypothetical protein
MPGTCIRLDRGLTSGDGRWTLINRRNLAKRLPDSRGTPRVRHGYLERRERRCEQRQREDCAEGTAPELMTADRRRVAQQPCHGERGTEYQRDFDEQDDVHVSGPPGRPCR